MNKIFRSLFTTMKYYFIQSEDNYSEKNLVAFNFFERKIYKDYKDSITYLTKGFDYLINVLDLYLNCTFYNKEQKSELEEYKIMINERKKKIKNKR